MRYSVSRVGCFNTCPYQFKLRYVDELETLPNFDDPANALYLGSALHKGIETTTEEGIRLYYESFPMITDAHINEAIKLRYYIPKVKALIPENAFHEVKIESPDFFLGFIDLLVKNEDGTYDIYDFKYSNNVEHYMESVQLHVYKHFVELVTGWKVSKLFFIFVPKIQIRQKKTETVQTFRNRLEEELGKKEPLKVEVPYDASKVHEFFKDIQAIEECKDWFKNESRLCDWCEFKEYCKEGIDYMLLPSVERRKPQDVKRTRLWVYGQPFSGKTTLADSFPNPLMLNTDGNIKYVTAPYIAIKDIVEVKGRVTEVTLAWQIFKDTIEELSKKQNEFKTIVVDLVEDLYESCRLYMYDKLNITHESDDSYRAWDKVRIEFLSTMRELTNLDYENIILISHEDTSKDLTKRSGERISSVKPNIQEKIANKLAGMVDSVIRCVVIDGKHMLSFKTDEVVFGGGRLSIHNEEIPNNYKELMKLIHGDEVPTTTTEEIVEEADEEPKEAIEAEADGTPTELTSEVEETPVETATPRRRRRRGE